MIDIKIKITKETNNKPNHIDIKYKKYVLIVLINNGIKCIKGYQLRDSQIYTLFVYLNQKEYPIPKK